ncbi:hypothetical protein [Amycolatopsis sp. NPDC003861]
MSTKTGTPSPLVSAPGSSVFAVRYGPQGDVPFTVEVRASAEGLVIDSPQFSVVVGDPAGDAAGEPILRLTARP